MKRKSFMTCLVSKVLNRKGMFRKDLKVFNLIVTSVRNYEYATLQNIIIMSNCIIKENTVKF